MTGTVQSADYPTLPWDPKVWRARLRHLQPAAFISAVLYRVGPSDPESLNPSFD